ncbi:hypothetical protein AD998_01850 [bacterium 336/3]|nr:hypothetical protein AD998_01850 [bacterium 336/3]
MCKEILSALIQSLATLIVGGFSIYFIRKQLIDNQGLQKRNIDLQWFKEIIFQPNIQRIESYFNKIFDLIEVELREETPSPLSLSKEIKGVQSLFREQFLFLIHEVDEKFERLLLDILDKLTDELTIEAGNIDLMNDHDEKERWKNKLKDLIFTSKSTFLYQFYKYKENH